MKKFFDFCLDELHLSRMDLEDAAGSVTFTDRALCYMKNRSIADLDDLPRIQNEIERKFSDVFFRLIDRTENPQVIVSYFEDFILGLSNENNDQMSKSRSSSNEEKLYSKMDVVFYAVDSDTCQKETISSEIYSLLGESSCRNMIESVNQASDIRFIKEQHSVTLHKIVSACRILELNYLEKVLTLLTKTLDKMKVELSEFIDLFNQTFVWVMELVQLSKQGSGDLLSEESSSSVLPEYKGLVATLEVASHK